MPQVARLAILLFILPWNASALADSANCDNYKRAILDLVNQHADALTAGVVEGDSCEAQVTQERSGHIKGVEFSDCRAATRQSAGSKLFEIGQLPRPAREECFEAEVHLYFAPQSRSQSSQ